ncbi:glyoxalase superfamily protein [Heyndrickxia acidicola]|uniref:Glyoxalase superfamily protein n=1 Tax=Heyndrickxia acidicola TaxID=209389 RepID=A0ABU6MHC8_9BACI|nr:glyoxalase superfamily protein [Heyndrickxia acidicola]MED1204086.1 glyoxalase superfamily protein [Heyndrickxia acidicola]
MDFHAVRLLVRDVHKSVEFYRDTLGFEGWIDALGEYAYFEEQHLALFKQSNMLSELEEESGKTVQKGPSVFLLQFEVKNVDEAYVLLKKKNVRFINPPHDRRDWGSRIAHFKDPDGNIIELYQSIRSKPANEMQ